MRIGVPKEIKCNEDRVGMTPSSVREVVAHGHEAIVQSNAGLAIGFDDAAYGRAGAKIVATPEDVFKEAEMIVKVKEPQPAECRMLRADQTWFTYLHLAPDPEQTRLLMQAGVAAIAYETITDRDGGLPLLAPMSEVAGRMSIQVGACALQIAAGGRGVLLGGVPGTASARVVIIGGGVVGTNAARMALGLGADVTVLDKSLPRLQYLDDTFGPAMKTIFATRDATEELVNNADLIIGAVLVPGAAAPKLVRRGQLKDMHKGAVLVDVAIDQGGCFETSRPTTHADPTYVIDDIVHYCVANMPGGVARTSTLALTNATLPYILTLADKGWRQALLDDTCLRDGLNLYNGRITYAAIAEALSKSYVPADEALAA